MTISIHIAIFIVLILTNVVTILVLAGLLNILCTIFDSFKFREAMKRKYRRDKNAKKSNK